MNSDDGDIGYVVYRWGFPCLDYPLDVSPHEFITWAYTTSFVHTYIYRVFSVFITCLIYWSNDYVNLCSLYRFPYMFSDLHVFTWSRIYCHFLILLVISCTCMPRPYHLIVYTRACYARHLTLSYVLAGVAKNPGSSCPDPGVWTVVALLYHQNGAAKAWISSYLSGPSFFQPFLDRLARFSSCYSWVLSRISYCTSCFCAS